MTLPRNTLITPLLVALVFAAGVAFFSALHGSRHGVTASSSPTGPAAHPRTTDQLIAAQQQVVRLHPDDSNGYALLADSYLQKVRETGDASFYTRAAGVLQ